jgi:hypothetical protein
MKDQPCVSYEMAERLKKAGYPQFILSGFHRHWDEKKGEYIHAPTAFDVIPLGWCVEKKLHAFAAKRYEFDPFGASETPTFIHENPHDAAAMAWLWEKENGA